MARGMTVLTAVCCVLLGFGCGKQQSVETYPPEGGAETPQVAATTVSVETAVVSPTPIASTDASMTAQSISPPADSIERAKMIQMALKNLNLYTGEIDGKIGPRTMEAIKEFQQTRDLKVDGKVGPLTWAKLSLYVSGPAPSSATEGVQE